VIRINLLGVERQKVKKAAAAPSFDLGQRLTVLCSLILVGSLLGIVWWWWSLRNTASELDAEIARSQREATQLRSLLNEVKTFEDRRGQLQQRVQLIEQLRSGQSVPVQLLDHVSRSLPDMLWLTEMSQENGAVTIQGRSSTLIALSDFVGNLGSTALLQKPIEIVNSQVEAVTGGAQTKGQPPLETIKFTVRAQLAGAAQPSTKGGRGTTAAPAAAAAGRK
jgi:type IV pilus assembly protein PilN